MKVEDSSSQNTEEISPKNRDFSTELEEIFQENPHRPKPSEDFILQSKSIDKSGSIKTEEVKYHVIMKPQY